MVGLTVVHPVDTLKIRIQANGGGALATASSIYNREGPLALYRGISAPMVAYGLINAVAFSTNTAVTRYLRDPRSVGGGAGPSQGDGPQASSGPPLVQNPWLVGLVGGGAAGLTSSLVRGPAERLKTVQQVAESSCGTGKIPESSAGRFEPPRRWRGSTASSAGGSRGRAPPSPRGAAVRGVPHLRPHSARVRARRGAGYGTAGIVLAGGSAGVVQWVVTYPLDVVKSKIQAFPPGTYRGMWDCAVKSAKAEGPLVFFRGIEMALLRAFPLHASIFLTCETIHSALARFREDADAEKRWEETGKM